MGGDGWGDSRFGFVQNAKDLESTTGFTVRGFPTSEEGLQQFELGKSVLSSKDPNVHVPGSAAALSILKIMDGVTELLCKSKAKNKKDFIQSFTKFGKKSFRSPWGVSIYNLNNGDITYGKSVRLK